MNVPEAASPRITTILVHALYGAVAVFCIWFVSWFLFPRAVAFSRETQLNFGGIASVGLQLSDIAFNGCWILAAVCVVGVVLSFFARGNPALSRPAAATLIGTSFLSTILALFLLVSACLAFNDAYISLARRQMVYSRTLESFALRQTAEGRFLSLQEALVREKGIQPKPIQDVSQLSRPDQRRRLSQIVELLQRSSDVGLRRRLLATSLPFRHMVETDRERSDIILRHARETGGAQNGHIGQFYDWLGANLNKDGWDPVPLYEMVFEPGG